MNKYENYNIFEALRQLEIYEWQAVHSDNKKHREEAIRMIDIIRREIEEFNRDQIDGY